jgi:hypothetical protein
MQNLIKWPTGLLPIRVVKSTQWIYWRDCTDSNGYTWQTRKKKTRGSPSVEVETDASPMPSAPKKSSPSKKTTLSPEEQALLIKTRREVVEKRLLRLEAKIAKDRALLQKYTIIVPSESVAEN